MKKCTRHLIGLIALATGIAIIISIILPNWLWMVFFAVALIVAGVICFR